MLTFKSNRLLLLYFLIAVTLSINPCYGLIYVDQNATGANNGTSWVNAYNELQDAFEEVNTSGIANEIWVAQGTYTPDWDATTSTHNGNQSTYFELQIDGTEVYGGFLGGETTRSARNYNANTTTLSGDLSGDDVITYPNFVNTGDNTNNLLIRVSCRNAIIDGFSITGLASALGWGGAVVFIPQTNQSKLLNCRLYHNQHNVLQDNGGGAIIENCLIFKNNLPNSNTAVLYSHGFPDGTLVTNCTFADNHTTGSLCEGMASEFYNNIFWGNTSDDMVTSTEELQLNTWSPMVAFENNILEGHTGTLTGRTSTSNSGSDPLFTNAAIDDYTLSSGSPAINAGNQAYSTQQFDIQFQSRVEDCEIDIGAHETSGSLGVVTPLVITTSPAYECTPNTVDLTLNWNDMNSTGGIVTYYDSDPSAGGASVVTNPTTISNNGDYFIEVDNGGCTGIGKIEVIITQSSDLQVPDSVVLCSGESSNLTTLWVDNNSTGGSMDYYSAKPYVSSNEIFNCCGPGSAREITVPGTYYFYLDNGNGCVSIDSVEILNATTLTVNSNPVDLVNVCDGSNEFFSIDVSGQGTLNYKWKFGSPGSIVGTNNDTLFFQPITLADDGIYEVEVWDACDTITVSGSTASVISCSTCNSPASTSITSSGPIEICEGANVSISGNYIDGGGTTLNGMHYVWYKSGNTPIATDYSPITGTIPDENLVSISSSDAGYYILRVEDGTNSSSSCYQEDSIQVIVNEYPSLNVVHPTTACPGETVNITTSWIDGAATGGTVTYYDPTLSVISSGSASMVSSAGTYSVAIDNAGCIDQKNINVTFYDSINIDNDLANLTACEGDTETLSITASGGSGILNYQWYFGNGSGFTTIGSNNNTHTISPISSSNGGQYYVEISDGCTGTTGVTKTSDTTNITVDDTVRFVAQPTNLNLCIGSNGSFATSATGSGTLSYQWHKNGLPITGATGPTLNFASVSSGDAGSYFVEVTNLCGTVASDDASLNINSTITPSVSISSDLYNICNGATVNLTATPFGGGTNPTYTFRNLTTSNIEGTSGQTANTQSSSALINTSSDSTKYELMVEMISNTTCLAPGASATVYDTITIVVDADADKADIIESDTIICSSGLALSSNPIDTSQSGNWAVVSSTSGVINSVGTVSNMIVNETAQYSYTVTSPLGICPVNSDTITVTRAGTLTNPVAIADTVCEGNNISLTGNTPAIGENSYWLDTDGVTLLSTNTSTTVSSLLPGSYTYTYVMSNGICPDASVTTTAQVLSGVLPIINVIPTDSSICSGGTTTLIADPISGFNGSQTYQWYINGAIQPGETGPTFTPTSIVSSDNITIEMTSDHPCPSSPTVSSSAPLINFVSPPVSIIDPATDQRICETDLPVTLTAIGSSDNNIHWYQDGVVQTSSDTIFSAYDPATYVLETSNTCGAQYDTINIQVDYLPKVTANVTSSSIFPSQSTTLIGTVTGSSYDSILWTGPGTLSNNNSLFASFTPSSSIGGIQTFTLNVYNGTCDPVTASTVVLVKTPIEIPNAFTPNNDGLNDTWAIEGLEAYPNCSIEILNRYGSPVYKSEGYPEPWNGTRNGKEMPIATYYYIIKLNISGNIATENEVYVGSVTIVK